MMEIKNSGIEKKVIKDGYIADLRLSRKYYDCVICKKIIGLGEKHYTVVVAGGGLGSLKFPDRVHIDCLETYLQRKGSK